MTKYTLAKDKSDGYGGNIPDIKTVTKKSELKKCLKNGWYEVDRFTPVITPIKKWWNNFSTNQKIAIIAIIVPCFAVFGWSLDKYFDNEYRVLKHKYNELENKYNKTNQVLILTSDSLKTEREKSEPIKEQLQPKTTSDKNPTDKRN
jgi:hypothetical protein